MFRPDSNRDRTDYSGILMPPDGYRLDRAVGTTYSLDLEALTAVDYLFRHNQNRVLVADEVGMGKTLIARGAIVKTARLRMEEKDDLFKVIYICSNQNIANQNIRKLDVTGKNAIG